MVHPDNPNFYLERDREAFRFPSSLPYDQQAEYRSKFDGTVTLGGEAYVALAQVSLATEYRPDTITVFEHLNNAGIQERRKTVFRADTVGWTGEQTAFRTTLYFGEATPIGQRLNTLREIQSQYRTEYQQAETTLDFRSWRREQIAREQAAAQGITLAEDSFLTDKAVNNIVIDPAAIPPQDALGEMSA